MVWIVSFELSQFCSLKPIVICIMFVQVFLSLLRLRRQFPSSTKECAVCSSGYGRGATNQCRTCSEGFKIGMFFLVTILALVSVVVAALLVVYVVRRAIDKVRARFGLRRD